MKILTILGSSRREGNTEYLVRKIVDGVQHTELFLGDYKLDPIIDERHREGGFNETHDDYESVLEQLLAHDIIVFATPVYWFGMSAQMKVFFDRWSQYLRDERFNMKAALQNKQAYVVTTGGSNPHITALPLIQQFGHIFDFVGMTYKDYMIGNAVKPGEVKEDILALQKAKQWNEHFKTLI
ncbi:MULTISPECIES: flavodoxin family protein [Pontibacillus]|uniref:Flavodoxin family protein n=1 Tax=Pontibacillus chungwhensis TaxID=265426 RepID=A0ABY8V247_9BACI|nr:MULTISPECIES: flavodoxin family protein [Pontibacillus]MCD5322271.1 flavodoxin family protein [Pontibacillus sp. HN14]WIF99563.1 flavodoxin family protein [Pontibacillus chungwhensis]